MSTPESTDYCLETTNDTFAFGFSNPIIPILP